MTAAYVCKATESNGIGCSSVQWSALALHFVPLILQMLLIDKVLSAVQE